jgi:hypothetical protein
LHGLRKGRPVSLLQPIEQEGVVHIDRDLLVDDLDRRVVANPEIKSSRTDPPLKLLKDLAFSRRGICNCRSAGLHHATPL